MCSWEETEKERASTSSIVVHDFPRPFSVRGSGGEGETLAAVAAGSWSLMLCCCLSMLKLSFSFFSSLERAALSGANPTI